MSTLAAIPPTVSVMEAARILGISPRSAYRAAASGDLPAVRIGSRIVIPSHHLLRLMEGKAA